MRVVDDCLIQLALAHRDVAEGLVGRADDDGRVLRGVTKRLLRVLRSAIEVSCIAVGNGQVPLGQGNQVLVALSLTKNKAFEAARTLSRKSPRSAAATAWLQYW